MEGIMLIYLICYIDMTLMIVYEDPTENCHGKFGSLIKYHYYYMIIIITTIIINYIIIMIILWLKLYYFFTIEVEPVLQDNSQEKSWIEESTPPWMPGWI